MSTKCNGVQKKEEGKSQWLLVPQCQRIVFKLLFGKRLAATDAGGKGKKVVGGKQPWNTSMCSPILRTSSEGLVPLGDGAHASRWQLATGAPSIPAGPKRALGHPYPTFHYQVGNYLLTACLPYNRT